MSQSNGIQQSSQANGDQPKVIDQTYSLTNLKQSISINDSLKNFKASFSITSLDKAPFYLAVISDDIPSSQIKFQNITQPMISGTLVNEKNEYKSYSLVLKSDSPTNVRIQMSVVPITSRVKADTNYMNIIIFLLILGAIVLFMYRK